MVRAKFRVIHVTKSWDKSASAVLYPVNPKATFEYDNEACVENEAFWTATPTGELKVHYSKWEAAPDPGDFYYIDMAPCDGPGSSKIEHRPWFLHSYERIGDQLAVALQQPWVTPLECGDGSRCATLKMGITNEAVWDFFTQPPGKKYSIELVPLLSIG